MKQVLALHALIGMHDGITGDVSDIRGDVSDIRGNVNGITGDVTGIRGDVDSAEISSDERAAGVDISMLMIPPR